MFTRVEVEKHKGRGEPVEEGGGLGAPRNWVRGRNVNTVATYPLVSYAFGSGVFPLQKCMHILTQAAINNMSCRISSVTGLVITFILTERKTVARDLTSRSLSSAAKLQVALCFLILRQWGSPQGLLTSLLQPFKRHHVAYELNEKLKADMS